MTNKDKTIRSIEKAMILLELIAAEGGSLRLQDMVNLTGISKSTLHGILSTLVTLGYIERRGANYTLGLRLKDLTRSLLNKEEQRRQLLSETLHKMATLSEESCYLAVACGLREYSYIDAIEKDTDGNSAYRQGKKEALTVSAIGKVLLAFDKHLVRPLRLSGNMTENLEAELKKIHLDGYAIELATTISGFNCLALPLLKKGKIIAVIGVCGPRNRLTLEKMIDLKRLFSLG
ncbi:IclR family transcriptional regulator [Rosenbergiella australiborealis]|uniref:IclR family transcriptional regulator n=1 Tax=Rosenbergiella australiborealis TaxID=1544696 RepID=UPI001F4DC656|nr:helix-turn-helix domain-containing protein [Rosenbergiella australiborealis]